MGVGRPGQGKEATQRPSCRHPNSEPRGVKGSGVIGAYHARRVAPLMARMLPLYQMVPEASFEGMVLVDEALPYSEVA